MVTPSGRFEYDVCWIGVGERQNMNVLCCKGSSLSLQN